MKTECRFKIDDKVIPLIGNYEGIICTVIKTEMDAGARNGWITVLTDTDKTQLLYAGEELIKYEN